MCFTRVGLIVWILCILTSCDLPHKVHYANPATLDMNFYSLVGVKKNKPKQQISVLTYWRKLNADGTKGDRFAIGGSNAFGRAINTSSFKKARIESVKLDSGVYYLDSFEFVESSNKQIITSQKGDYTQRNGWNDRLNAPLYVSIILQEGEHLSLPPVEVVLSADKNTSLPHLADKVYSVVFYVQDCDNKALDKLQRGARFQIKCTNSAQSNLESDQEGHIFDMLNLYQKE